MGPPGPSSPGGSYYEARSAAGQVTTDLDFLDGAGIDILCGVPALFSTIHIGDNGSEVSVRGLRFTGDDVTYYADEILLILDTSFGETAYFSGMVESPSGDTYQLEVYFKGWDGSSDCVTRVSVIPLEKAELTPD